MGVEYCDENGKGHYFKTKFFVSEAIKNAVGYDDKNMLLHAINIGLPELWESEEARALLAHYVRTGTSAGKGWKPKKNKLDDQLNIRIFERVHYWHGLGLPIFSRTNEATACHKVAKELSLAASTIYKRFNNIQKAKNPGAKIASAMIEVDSRENNKVPSK